MPPQTPSDQLRAKDLLKNGEIAIREILGHGTVAVLASRAWRRPAGSSARLFKKLAEDDPFAPPPEVAPKPDHRPVYVAGRFVRLEEPATGGPAASLPTPEGKIPRWVEKLQELKEAKPTPSPHPVKSPAQTHTPEFGAKPDVPLDRRPPRIAPLQEASSSGRMFARPTRTETAHGAPPVNEDGELDRRPPRIVGERPQRPDSPQPRQRPPPALDADGNPIDRRPPMVRHVPKDERGEPLRAWRDRRRAMETGIPLEPLPEPVLPERAPFEPPKPAIAETPPEEPAETPEAPLAAEPTPEEPAIEPPAEPGLDDLFAAPPRRPPPSGGLDDLFGGMQEGRVRMGRRKKKLAQAEPEPEPEPEEEKPAEEIDRTPPKLDVDPNKLPKG